MKNYSEEIKESQIILDQKSISIVSNILSNHPLLFYETETTEIPIYQQSILKLFKMGNQTPEELILFAYRSPFDTTRSKDHSSNKKSSISSREIQEKIKNKFHTLIEREDDNNTLSTSNQRNIFNENSSNQLLVQDIIKHKNSNFRKESESFIEQNYSLIIFLLKLIYVLIFIFSIFLLVNFIFVVFKFIEYGILNGIYINYLLEFGLVIPTSAFGLVYAYSYEKENRSENENKIIMKKMKVSNGLLLALIFVTATLFIYVNYFSGDANLTNYITENTFFNYYCVLIVLSCLIALAINLNMEKYANEKNRNYISLREPLIIKE